MVKHFSILIRGRVQGVFYRASAKEMAMQLGIKGIVRNEEDGSVYIEAEGEEDALNQFISWCRKGPPRAMVTDVHVEEGSINNYSSFRIDR
jgi:acylphosphatase